MFESGLEFLRADFHLHTQKDKEFSYSGEPNEFVKSYISALKQANISVGVITNHNKFDKDEYKALKRAASKEKIFITAMPLSRHLSVLIVIIAQIQSIHILKAQSLENDDCAFSYSSSINSITSSTRQCSSLQSRAIVLVETLLPFLIE